jgi:hypothetical protein
MFARALLALRVVTSMSRAGLADIMMVSWRRPKQRVGPVFIAGAILATCFVPMLGAQRHRPPYLRRQGSATQLVVDDKPYLVLGGELGNATSSSLEDMQPIWPKLVALNLNTVLVPIYWELIEPAEGKFDFTLVDGLIHEARNHNLHIVPLWFASGRTACRAMPLPG